MAVEAWRARCKGLEIEAARKGKQLEECARLIEDYEKALRRVRDCGDVARAVLR